MTNATCFSEEELRRYLLGELNEEVSGLVATHVENCQDCEQTVVQLDRDSDTLIASLREPVDAPKEHASTFQLALDRAKACRIEASNEAEDSLRQLPQLRDYELLEPLAEGGMGTVYRARHVRLNRVVALKVLPARWLKNPVIVARFEREMKAVGSLQHPAIVQATDGGEAEGVHFLVMELIEGPDCSSIVRDLGPLDIADACEIAQQAAVGMAYVHERGIIHRDLKPSNLMLTRAGDVKVLDLGLARVAGERLAGDELTTVGQLMGTLDYMAPEQLENSHDVDRRTDIYSLGATLYKLLTGRSPHVSDPSEPILTKIRRIATEAPTPLAEHLPDAPVGLLQLVDRMLSHSAESRPQSMDEVAESLDAISANSDLIKIAKRAGRAARKRERNQTSPLSAGASIFGVTEPDANRGRSRNDRLLRGLAAGGMFLIIAMGVFITLQTTAGQLVIETSAPDVEIEILKSGREHRQLTLTQKAESLRLGTGDYEVRIVGKSDGLKIEDGVFTLTRGDTWLVKITHTERPLVPNASGGGDDIAQLPTFEGRTLPQWLSLLRTERSAKQLVDGCSALEKLGSPADSKAMADALLIAIRSHGQRAEYGDAETRTPIWTTVSDLLAGLDQETVTLAMTRELSDEPAAAKSFILTYLSNQQERVRPVTNSKLLQQVDKIASDRNSDQRAKAMSVLREIGPLDQAIPRFVAALSDRESDIRLFAATALVELNSNTPLVVSALRDAAREGPVYQKAQAIWLLGDIGKEASPAVPDLLKYIQEPDSLENSEPTYSFWKSGLGVSASVKDASIRALAEIGDRSAAETLIAEWERRSYGTPRPAVPTPAWEKNPRVTIRSENESWLADAIEKLYGMSPKITRGPNRQSVTVWQIGKLNFETAYRLAFSPSANTDPDHLYETAKSLAPKAHEYQLEFARMYLSSVSRAPGPRDLELEGKMSELLADGYDRVLVVTQLLDRWSSYMNLDDNRWKKMEKEEALATFQEIVIRVASGEDDWQQTTLPGLLETADRGSQLAATVLLHLYDEMEDAQDRANSIRHILGIIAEGGFVEDDRYCQSVEEWMRIEHHRADTRTQLRESSGETWKDLSIGILRGGLLDDEMLDIIKTRFHDGSIDVGHLTNWVFSLTLEQPKLKQFALDLLRDPVLDEPALVMVQGNKREQTSVRARHILPNLEVVPDASRDFFRPYLEKLSKDGIDGEAESATRILKKWKT